MKTERVKNSIYNGLSGLIITLLLTILSFLTRSIFIRTLGEQVLGVEGLFTNILTLLSLAELGFGTAISFSLYEPLAKKDTNKIQIIMAYFKKAYKKISLIIFLCGLICLPLLPLLVKGYSVSYNLRIVFIMFLLDTSTSYLTSYNSILLEADQKNYKITLIRVIANLLTYGLQIFVLLVYQDYYLYLVIMLVFRLVERLSMYFYIKKLYKNELKDNSTLIDSKTKDKINENIKGILFHKVGDFIVNGTDNIIISSLLNISLTGIYANYLSITGVLKSTIIAIINSTTSSFGNLNVSENEDTKLNVFNVINMISYLIIGIACICFFLVVNSFITIWIGGEYTLGFISVILITINLYLYTVQLPIQVVKSSSGLYYIDRYVGIVQAVINLVVSIIGAKLWGINGVLIGTTISYILTTSWSKAYIVYREVFKTKFFSYLKMLISNIIIIVISILLSKFLFTKLCFGSTILWIIGKCIIGTVVYSIMFVLAYGRTKEFKYLFDLFIKKKLFKK